ncbi:MAG: hypothetical protein M3362_00525 [Acidobacteriota bacterium]|nr:hypothetical protein [Acidobacteriota bacterium]
MTFSGEKFPGDEGEASEKKSIEIAGYVVTQLSETEYEAENAAQRLDFFFNASDPDAVEVFVFDSERPTDSAQDPCIKAFYADDLEEAVTKAMALKRELIH